MQGKYLSGAHPDSNDFLTERPAKPTWLLPAADQLSESFVPGGPTH